MGANSAGSRERVMFRLANRLIEEGASVDIGVSAPRPSWRQEAATGAHLIDIANPFTKHLQNLIRIMLSPPALKRYFRLRHPDIAMTLSIPTALAALTASRRSSVGTKVVVRQSNVVHIPGSARFGDADGLAKVMLESLEAPPPRDRQRARAKQFDAKRTVDGYLRVLQGVLASDSRSSAETGRQCGMTTRHDAHGTIVDRAGREHDTDIIPFHVPMIGVVLPGYEFGAARLRRFLA